MLALQSASRDDHLISSTVPILKRGIIDNSTHNTENQYTIPRIHPLVSSFNTIRPVRSCDFPFLNEPSFMEHYEFSKHPNGIVSRYPLVLSAKDRMENNPYRFWQAIHDYILSLDSTGGLSEQQFRNTIEHNIPSDMWAKVIRQGKKYQPTPKKANGSNTEELYTHFTEDSREKLYATPSKYILKSLFALFYTVERRSRDFSAYLTDSSLVTYNDEKYNVVLQCLLSTFSGRIDYKLMTVSRKARRLIDEQFFDLDPDTGLSSEYLQKWERNPNTYRLAEDTYMRFLIVLQEVLMEENGTALQDYLKEKFNRERKMGHKGKCCSKSVRHRKRCEKSKRV